MTQNFPISGMTCQHCVSRVQNLLSNVVGIDHVTVSLMPPRAHVSGQNIDMSALMAALADTQFTIGSAITPKKVTR